MVAVGDQIRDSKEEKFLMTKMWDAVLSEEVMIDKEIVLDDESNKLN